MNRGIIDAFRTKGISPHVHFSVAKRIGAAKVRGEIMAESKTDLRVVRTRKLIRDAFMDMVGEVGVARITVKDLAERAGINRKSFLCTSNLSKRCTTA